MGRSAPARTYSEFVAWQTPRLKVRRLVRDFAVSLLSAGKSIDRSRGWVRFPYYHHVFDDERAGFARQLDFLHRFGDFLSLDQVVDMLESGDPIVGNNFCVTFDDGFKNNLTNALPILVERDIPAAFFLATRYVGTSPEKDREALTGFYDHGKVLMEFMDWDDIRAMAKAGMTIGSHTVGHKRLAGMKEDDVRRELNDSKAIIERELGQPCEHFCFPFGRRGAHWIPGLHPKMVAQAGYRSGLTTERGPMRTDGNPFEIRRDHTLANWGTGQLRYFFSQD